MRVEYIGSINIDAVTHRPYRSRCSYGLPKNWIMRVDKIEGDLYYCSWGDGYGVFMKHNLRLL